MRLMSLCCLAVLLSLTGFSLGQEPESAKTPQVLRPLPEKYADQYRKFQGIPSLAVTDNNHVWAAWFTGGETEPADENYIVVAVSRDRGKTWSEPLFAVDLDGPCRLSDPQIWYAPDKRLYLFWTQDVKEGKHGCRKVWYMYAENPNAEEPKWSDKPTFFTDGIMLNKPIVDSRDRWIFPVSIINVGSKEWAHPEDTSPNGPSGAWFVVSQDQGKTLEYLGRGYVPPEVANYNEHSIVELKDGRFWIFNRFNGGIGQFFSSDGGKTWTDFEPAPLVNPIARTFLRRMKSGNLILVKNGPLYQNVWRSRLTVYLSKDDGQTWEGGLVIDERGGGAAENDVSYPDGDQMPDGTIFIIYDHGRTHYKEILCARITEEDILAKKLVSPESELKILVNQATGEISK